MRSQTEPREPAASRFALGVTWLGGAVKLSLVARFLRWRGLEKVWSLKRLLSTWGQVDKAESEKFRRAAWHAGLETSRPKI